jgi:nucleotide-binding universal stress UspA family protein
MNTSVVVGFDGSAAADAAVRHGARQAARRGSELRIVHAFGWFVLLAPMYPPMRTSTVVGEKLCWTCSPGPRPTYATNSRL